MSRSAMEVTTPRGQILVVVAAGLVVLLVIAALVIDLGFSWMLRRQEQNAADPAALAAARWLQTDAGDPRDPRPEALTEACFYAQENGFFTDDTADCAAARAAGALRVNWPPIGGDYSGRTDAVQVVISATHESFFARVFGQDFATVTTGAVALNTAGNSNTSSLVALKPNCDGGGSAGTITGGGRVSIFPITPGTPGGYVHVNSTCGSAAAISDDQCVGGGQKALDINGGSRLVTPFAYTVGSCVTAGGGALECVDTAPCLDEDAVPLADPLATLPEPRLTDFPNGECPNGDPSTPESDSACELKKSGSICPGSGTGICRLQPGVYYGGWDVKSNVRVELEPGMYILAGGGIKLSGGSSIEAVTNATGVEARVTIFSTDGPGCPDIGAQCQGDITFTASQAFRAKATNSVTCQAVSPQICPWNGILLWQDGTASRPTLAVKLGGQSSTIMSGTLYAPKADVTINGGNGTSGCSGTVTASCLAIQIISWTWKIDGNAVVDMPYDPNGLYQFDGRGLVD